MITRDDGFTRREADGSQVVLTIDDRVARITLDNPPLNVLKLETVTAIADAVQTAAKEPDLCAFVFEAAPGCRAFSAGFAAEEHRPEIAYQLLDAFHSIFRGLDFHSKPTVAIIHEAALGAGCELAAFCDIVVASDRARFGLPEIKMGVFPPLACVYLPRIVGQKRAREMILTGTLVSAADAQRMGLVTTVVPAAQLDAKANELLATLRSLSASVLETTRRALVESAGIPTEEALARVEDIYLNQLMSLKDPGEGLIAFLERRAPEWKHR